MNGLLARLFRKTQRITTALAQPLAPRVDADATSHWRRYDLVTNAQRTVEGPPSGRGHGSGAKLAAAFNHAWRTVLDAATTADPALPTRAGSLCWSSRSSSRPAWWNRPCMAWTWHRRWAAPVASQQGLRTTRAVLIGLLGAPLPDELNRK